MTDTAGNWDAITLDVGNTLVFPEPSLEHIYREVAQRHDLSLDTSFSEATFANVWRLEQRRRDGQLLYGTTHEEAVEFWFAVNRRLFPSSEVAEPKLQCFVRDLYFTFGRGAAWRITHDLHDLISACRLRNIQVALLSNWDMRLRDILSELGLLSIIDVIVISAEHGVEKPDSEIFLRTVSQLNVMPQRALHVGDTWDDDVVGAVKAGLHAAWLNPNSQPIPDPTVPVHVIRTLSDLIPLL